MRANKCRTGGILGMAQGALILKRKVGLANAKEINLGQDQPF